MITETAFKALLQEDIFTVKSFHLFDVVHFNVLYAAEVRSNFSNISAMLLT